MGLTNRETHGIINTENKKEVNTMKTFEYAQTKNAKNQV